ncbi:hypothetical protein L1987_84736 [Smallanthus sonchifolius]|uniref:Uncharacterized protein n=1 Tax=Smallanthus sonchifolius TaxID=185202 RepID=A0ACB8XUR8_9ASTR|nr:hypothetical protein L1987_84736 [Smallanthus sonchifolius]
MHFYNLLWSYWHTYDIWIVCHAFTKVNDPELKAFIKRHIGQPLARPASELLHDSFLVETSSEESDGSTYRQQRIRHKEMEDFKSRAVLNYHMDGSAPKGHTSMLSSPFSSPNVSALLKIKIISWSQETGLPASVCVHVGGRFFNLHKVMDTLTENYLIRMKLNYHKISQEDQRFANSRSQNLLESPRIDADDTRNQPLSLLLQKDLDQPEFCKKEYESTSFRIQTLEQLMTLKRSIQLQNTSKKREQVSKKVEPVRPYGLEGRTMSKKRTPLGQVTSCIGTVNLTSQRRYASRLLNVFRRFSFFGRTKSKKKAGVTSVLSKAM